jgi:preprotein translocase subunit SecE
MVSDKKDGSATASASSDVKPGFNLATFFQETKDELGKITWPSRQQLLSESLSVIVMVTLSAALVYLADQLFGWLALKIF